MIAATMIEVIAAAILFMLRYRSKVREIILIVDYCEILKKMLTYFNKCDIIKINILSDVII